MRNIIKNINLWMVASLVVASSVFGQSGSCPAPCPPQPCEEPCPHPAPPTQLCNQDPCCPSWETPVLNAGYNYPACVRTRCPWDVNFDLSFIYWQALQENMEFALTGFQEVGTTVTESNVVGMDFDFQPGFKLGMGGCLDHDNWDARIVYTYFHGNHKRGFSIDPDSPNLTLDAMWGIPDVSGSTGSIYKTAKEKWRLYMDAIDLSLGRWHYVGTQFTVRPNFGARALWLRQKASVNYSGTDNTTAVASQVKSKNTSWALGARAGLDTNWTIGRGFRVIGNANADLLYTRYTALSGSDSETRTTDQGVITVETRRFKQKGYGAVKPHLDMDIGFGWGTYLDCNNWYLDFSATYGYQVFFDQNMTRFWVDDVADGYSFSPNGNLYVHGLTLNAKLDF